MAARRQAGHVLAVLFLVVAAGMLMDVEAVFALAQARQIGGDAQAPRGILEHHGAEDRPDARGRGLMHGDGDRRRLGAGGNDKGRQRGRDEGFHEVSPKDG